MSLSRNAIKTSFLLLFLISKSSGQIEFGTPTPLPEPINNEWLNWKSTISADSLTLYWASNRPGMGDLDIWTSSRTSVSEPWGDPLALAAPINSSASESEPSISSDGLELYFARGTSGLERNSYDLWVSRRASVDDDWGDPQELSSIVNSPSEEADPSVSADGLELYFDSNRSGSFNIYVSRRESKNDPFGEPEVVLNSTGYANISPDGLMLFSSVTLDLAVSTRETTSDSFGSPSLLNEINTADFNEYDGALSSDGRTFYFTSDRPGVPTGEAFGEVGLWQVNVVPEPSTGILAIIGLCLLSARCRRSARV